MLTNCKRLKMKAADGKQRFTDAATTEQLLRILQSIPSPKAEPMKMWLAQVGSERIDETLDPELIAERLIETYERQNNDGHSSQNTVYYIGTLGHLPTIARFIVLD